jgi:hypothetical protein
MNFEFARMSLFMVLLAMFGATPAWGWSYSTQISAGVSPSAQTTSIAFNPRWRCFDFAEVYLGAGARQSFFRGHELELETAEHEAIERGELSRVTSISPRIFALNAFISADVWILDWFELGFNLDVGGVSFGTSQSGRYGETGFDTTYELSPTRWNMLRGNTRDLGTLNSEFFVNVPMKPGLDLRLGLSHFFAEMRTQTPLKYGGRRFRTVRNLALVSVRLSH